MLTSLLEAKSQLESDGLYVSSGTPESLWIAGKLHDAGDGIRISNDACVVRQGAGHWLAIFPADGLLTYEVPGSLESVVTLVRDVYHFHRSHPGPLKSAFRQVVDDPDQYVAGRSLASA